VIVLKCGWDDGEGLVLMMFDSVMLMLGVF